MDEKDNDYNQNNTTNNRVDPNVRVRSGKVSKEKPRNERRAVNMKDEVDAKDMEGPQNINSDSGSDAIANNSGSDKQTATTSTVTEPLVENEKKSTETKEETTTTVSSGSMGGDNTIPDVSKEKIDTKPELETQGENSMGENKTDVPKDNPTDSTENKETEDLASLTTKVTDQEKPPKQESGGMGGGDKKASFVEFATKVDKKEEGEKKDVEGEKKEGTSTSATTDFVADLLKKEEEKEKAKLNKGKEEVVVSEESDKEPKKNEVKVKKDPTLNVENDKATDKNKVVKLEDGTNTTDTVISEGGMGEGDQDLNPKVEANSGEKEDTSALNFDNGKNEGEMIGRSVGYGMKIEIDEEAQKSQSVPKGETPKPVYKKTSFDSLYPDDVDGTKVEDAKSKFIAESHAKAKKEEETAPNYWSGYISGYNSGYQQGERYKKEEAENKAKKAREAELNKPDYRLGLEVGKLAAMLSVKTGGKGDTPFELKTQGEKPIEYKTTLAIVRKNQQEGLDPAGNKVGEVELYQNAFTVGYNMAYQEAFTAKNKQPTHQDKLADPNFRKGYEEGNKLGRGQNLTPKEKDELEATKKGHLSKEGTTKAEKDSAYAKERGAFIYGYNSAYYQLQAEAKAKAKALQEKKEKDPVYQLGKTAGTIKGILASVFGDAGFRPILKNNQEDVLKENGIPFTVPKAISDIILGEKMPDTHELLAKPASEADPVKKKELEDKKSEQLGFFRESYTRSFLDGYKKGQEDKGTFEQNKQRNDPDYQRAMTVVYNGEEGSKESGGVVKLDLNPGGLVAYASYKLRFLEDNDPQKAALEKAIAFEKGKVDKEEEGYKLGFNQSYSYFASKLANPKDKVYLAIAGQKALDGYRGRTEEEKEYYDVGAAFANQKLNKQNELKEKKAKGEDTAAAESLMLKVFNASKIAIKSKIASQISASQKEEGKAVPSFDGAKTMEALDAELENTLSPEQLGKVRTAFQFFNNGYNAVMLNAFKAVAKSDKGNDKKELGENLKQEQKDFEGKANSTKEVKVDNFDKVKFSEAGIARALAKDKATKLYEQAAEEAYTTAYKAYTKLTGKGASRKPVGTANGIENLFKKDDFNKRVLSKQQELINENKNLKDGDAQKINDKELEIIVNGFLYFFIKGFNYVDNLNGTPQPYGMAHGWAHGNNFVQGFNGEEEDKAGSATAYAEGKMAAQSEKSYGTFQEGMANAAEEESIGDENSEDTGWGGEEDLEDVENSYKEGRSDAKKAWHKIILIIEKQEIPENYGSDVQLKIMEKGTRDTELVDIENDVDEAQSLWDSKESYIELAVNYFDFKLKSKYYKVAVTNSGFKEGDKFDDKQQKIISDNYDALVKTFLDRYKKGYSDVINELKTTTALNVNSKLFYACGFKDGFVRIRGAENLPKELQAVVAKKEEIDDKNEQEIAIDKTHKEYLNGEAKGAEIGLKIQTGLIEETQLGNELAAHNKAQVQREKSLKNSNDESEDDSEDDETKQTTYQQVEKNDYTKGKENGVLAGHEAAKEEHHALQKPVPIDYRLVEEVDTESTSGLSGMGGNKEVVPKKESDEQTKEPIFSDLFIEGFNESYWKARDAKAGEIEGIKAVLDGSDAYNIAAHYVVISNDNEVVEEGKRAIKHQAIFENSFINAREAARVNPDAKELLKKVSKIEPKVDKNKIQTEEEKQQEFVKSQIEKSHTAALTAAQKAAQQYAYVKAVLEMNVGDKIEEMKKALELVQGKGFTKEELAENKKKEELAAKKKKEEEEKGLGEGSSGMGGTELSEEQIKAKAKEDRLEEKKNRDAAEKFRVARELMENYKTITPILTDEKGEVVPCTEKWLDETKTKFITKPDNLSIDKKISDGMGQIAKHFVGGENETEVSIEDWDASLETKEKEGAVTNNEGKGKEKVDDDKAKKEQDKKKKFSYHYLVPEEEKVKIRAEFTAAFAEEHPVSYSKAIMDYSNLYLFDKMGSTTPSNTTTTTTTTTSNNEQDENDRETLAGIMDGLMNAEVTDGSNIKFNDLPILDVFQEQEHKLEDAHKEIRKEREKTFKVEFQILDLKDVLVKKEKETGSKSELEKKIAHLDKETEADEIEKLQQSLDSLVSLESKIKNLDLSIDESRETMEKSTDDIRLFLKNRLKLNLPKSANGKILDYIDYFDKKLIIEGPFSYSTSMFKMSQKGKLTVYENAEDVRIDANITIDKEDYDFKAAGFEYIEDKNSIALFSGKAVVPRLEGSNSSELQEYKFKDLGFDLNKSLRSQLKLQQNKLEAGPIHKSTGSRERDSSQSLLDKDADQNLEEVI